MCTIAFAWQALADAQFAVAANRDEALDRESLPPRLLEAGPEVVAPQDVEAGGTWLGVTERGLFVAITNRWTAEGPPDLPAERSRGLLVRDALRAEDAAAAVDLVREQVAEERYAGFNLLVADADRATYLEWDGELRVDDLDPGVHVIVNPGIDEAGDRAVQLRDELAVGGASGSGRQSDDGKARSGGPAADPAADPSEGHGPAADAESGAGPSASAGAAAEAEWEGEGGELEGEAEAEEQDARPGGGAPTTAADWLDFAADRLGDHEFEVCVHRDGFGTRSSSLLSIGTDGRTTYCFADGPPCETEYEPVDCPTAFLDRRG